MAGHTTVLHPDTITDGGKLPDPVHEHFAYLVANGASYTQAIKIAAPDRPAPHNAGARMAKLPEVQLRISEMAGNALAILEKAPESTKTIADRIAVVDNKWRKIEDIFESRAIEYDENYPDVPGGQTGLFTWDLKVTGSGENAMSEKVHHVDYKLLQESRELLRLAHEWDTRAKSLKSLHLHAHQHAAKQDGLEEMLAKATPTQRKAIMEAFPVVAEALDTGESKA